MAELNNQAGQARGAGRRRSKKSSTRVDLTPMVDFPAYEKDMIKGASSMPVN